MPKILAILAICFIVFNFIFKMLSSLFTPDNSNNYKKTEAKKTNINITKKAQKTGDYIDFEEIN